MTAFDAIIVGGGHNGLTCAAYLARAGVRVCVVERREVLGGACVTEELWPGRRVSRASYVVSMLQPKIVADLRLHEHGYEAIALDPSYATFGPDGRPILFANDIARTQESIARYSRRDAAAYPGFEELLERTASFLRPLLLRPPPALGSKRPGDLLGLLREAGRAAGLARRDVLELFRVMTMSVGDLLDDWFETDELKGAIGSTGVVGVWAGPRTPGTAYNLLHHALGELNGVKGAWGHVKGGMGAISQALARSAEAHGAEIRTDAAVRSIDVSGGRTTGVTLESGEQVLSPVVISGAHPRTTVLDLVGAEHFPDEVATDMRRYRSRGGSVKINCILSEPPRYAAGGEQLLRTGVAICPSLDYLERAWQDAMRGEPALGPVPRGGGARRAWTRRSPTTARCVMTMFTQYGPHRERGLARRRARGVRGALLRHPGRARAERRATRWWSTRCSHRRTSSASSASPAARSSRASRASTRWRSCAPLPSWPSTRRRSTASICAVQAPTPAGG